LAEHRRLVSSGEQAVVAREDGDVAAALAAAAHVVDAVYELPYLAHAPMEPNNAACRMGDDGVLEVWAGTEGPDYTQMAAAAAGRVTAFWQQIAAEPTSPNLPGVAEVLMKGGVDYMTTSGAIDGPYALASFKLETTNVQTGVPIMVWRSVGNSHTEFARES